MVVASDEDPPPKKTVSEAELSEFAQWGMEFLDLLSRIPTAEENQ